MILGQMVVGEGVVEDRRQLEVEADSPAKRGIAGTTQASKWQGGALEGGQRLCGFDTRRGEAAHLVLGCSISSLVDAGDLVG